MNIIILGAGQMGSSMVDILASEANNITVVDKNLPLLHELQDRLDINTVHGHASHPDILLKAGAEDADMILAVTNSDDTNMIACQIAYTLFHVPTKVARIRSQNYLNQEDNIFVQEVLPIDVLINPEQLVVDHIMRLVQFHGALQVLNFANDTVQLVAVRAIEGSPLIGHTIAQMSGHMPAVKFKVVVVYRNKRAIFPNSDTTIEADDEVFFLSSKENIRLVMQEIHKKEPPIKRIMLVGGGNIGGLLAERLEHNYQVKIIDGDRNKTKALAEKLDKTLVLLGDGGDDALLREENIDEMDVFISLTNNDEVNIVSGMLAKHMGSKKVIAIINRSAYANLVDESTIDIAISPRQISSGALLAYVRRGDVVAVHSLHRGAAEAIEAVAHGDERTSDVVGRSVHDIKLPQGTTIGAIVRDGEVFMLKDEVIIQADDHVIMFLANKDKLEEVERLFQVRFGFI